MIHTRYFKLLATLGLGLFGLMGNVSANVAPNPPAATYTFVGYCEDCAQTFPALPSGVTAALQLQSFTPGNSVSPANFFSFLYSGSSLFQPFFVSQTDAGWNLIGDVFPADGGNFAADLTFSGALLNGETPENFVFQTTSDGRFTLSTGSGCSGGAGEEALIDTCTVEDLGTGLWQLTQSTPAPNDVPEPGSLALLGLALAGLGLTRRSKR